MEEKEGWLHGVQLVVMVPMPGEHPPWQPHDANVPRNNKSKATNIHALLQKEFLSSCLTFSVNRSATSDWPVNARVG